MMERLAQFAGTMAITWLALAGMIATAHAGSVKITEKTKFYTITGKTAQQFAISMSRRGPYSRAHRARSWATASRDLSYQLTNTKSAKNCRVKDVNVSLKITYQMPKPRSLRGVSKKHRTRWQRMYRLLDTHEKVHGRFYKEFARDLRRQLLRMKPAGSCRALDRKASKLVERLSEKDRLRNQRFDARDTRNYRRMTRLYSGT
ncbi:MAG: DUF922 domain-containing protein [Pseudomonadota bacterium]